MTRLTRTETARLQGRSQNSEQEEASFEHRRRESQGGSGSGVLNFPPENFEI